LPTPPDFVSCLNSNSFRVSRASLRGCHFCQNISERGGIMKRVYCLYRESKAEKIIEDEIPMQQEACRDYAKSRGG